MRLSLAHSVLVAYFPVNRKRVPCCIFPVRFLNLINLRYKRQYTSPCTVLTHMTSVKLSPEKSREGGARDMWFWEKRGANQHNRHVRPPTTEPFCIATAVSVQSANSRPCWCLPLQGISLLSSSCLVISKCLVKSCILLVLHGTHLPTIYNPAGQATE